MDNSFKLKDYIQNLIDGGTMLIDGLVKNFDNKYFKTHLLEYGKGESIQENKKNHDAKINYTYANNENVINMLEPIKSVFMMRPQGNGDSHHDMPKIVLQTLDSSSSYTETVNVVT